MVQYKNVNNQNHNLQENDQESKSVSGNSLQIPKITKINSKKSNKNGKLLKNNNKSKTKNNNNESNNNNKINNEK